MKFLFAIVCLLSLSLHAAVPPGTKNALKNSAILRGTGAIHGGLSGEGFSLMAVKSTVGKNKQLERLTIAMGDANFRAYKGSPGYFHIENSVESKRVVINFSQMLNSKLDSKSLQAAFAKSPFVQNTEMVFDPQTQTTSLILNVKRPVSIRAIPVAGTQKQLAHLNIDLFDDSLLNRKKK